MVRRWWKISVIEKLRKKINEKPIRKDIAFEDAQRLLEHLGCTVENDSGGSHFAVKYPGIAGAIIIPHHAHQALKPYNVRDVQNLINEIESQKEDK